MWIAPLAAIAALTFLYLLPPGEYWIYPECLFRSFTGLSCPGCGSLRSVHHLLHGEFTTAFQLNPLLYLLPPALVVCRRHLQKPGVLWSFIGIVVLFTIARNL